MDSKMNFSEILPQGLRRARWPQIKQNTSRRMSASLYRLARQLVGARCKVFQSQLGPIEYFETPKRAGQETVVFLHGFADCKEGFLTPLLHLFKSFHIIVPDLPGFGQSFKTPGLAYTLDNYSTWLGELFEAIGVQKYHVVGNSLGGAVAIRMALAYPDKIQSLAILDSAGVILKDHPSFYSDMFSGKNLFAIRNRQEFDYFLHRVFHRSKLIPWPIKESIYQQFLDNAAWYESMLGDLTEGVRNFDDPEIDAKTLNNRLKDIQPRTLILWGKHDTFFPYQTAYYIHGQIPGSELHILENTGHSPQLEAPGAFSKIYKNFITKKV